MLICLALAAAFSDSSMAEIPALSAEIAAEAQALSIETRVTPALLMRIDDFSSDAERLSSMLQSAGAGQDMPCIFQGIAKDARNRAAEFAAAAKAVFRPDLYDAALPNLKSDLEGEPADGIGAFAGPAFDPDNVTGHLAAWTIKR